MTIFQPIVDPHNYSDFNCHCDCYSWPEDYSINNFTRGLQNPFFVVIWTTYLRNDTSKHLKGRLGPPVSNVFWINGGPLGPPVSNVFWINGGPLGPPVSNVFGSMEVHWGPPWVTFFGSMEVCWGPPWVTFLDQWRSVGAKEVSWIQFCTKMYLTELNPGPTIPI